jgi:hypothetical protein
MTPRTKSFGMNVNHILTLFKTVIVLVSVVRRCTILMTELKRECIGAKIRG